MNKEEIVRQACIIYSRVVGWITPTKNWNPGKKSEFGDRVNYEVETEDE